MDQNSKRRMSKEKSGAILKVIVKHFFVEKEVTSTLVMDSLYSGLKVLEGQYKAKKNNGKHLDVEQQSIPIIQMEKDMFVLVEDVLLLLERFALEQRPPKDEKGPQNRIKKRGKRGIDYKVPSVSIEDARHAKEESVIYELRQRLGSQELTVATILRFSSNSFAHMQIEARNNNLEMQSVNNRKLIEDLDRLVEKVCIPAEVKEKRAELLQFQKHTLKCL
nr:MATH domain-containing protein At5g43560 [Ipomoea batatas]